jgi:hypothetical protein
MTEGNWRLGLFVDEYKATSKSRSSRISASEFAWAA